MIFNQSTILFGIKPEDQYAINLISKAFANNQRLKSMFNQNINPQKALNHLITYCYALVKKKKQVFVSQDKNTYMLYYRKSLFNKNLIDWLNYLSLAIKVIGIKKLPKIYKKEKFVSAIRNKEIQKQGDLDYFYVWFLAQTDKASPRDLYKAKTFITNEAEKIALPVYMETTCPRLKRIYEAQGFEMYDSFFDETTNVKVWFGRYAQKPKSFASKFKIYRR